MLNLELLEKVRDKILFEPTQHKQDKWMTVVGDIGQINAGAEVSCPTTGCVAGWACALSGDVAVLYDEHRRYTDDDKVVYTVYDVKDKNGTFWEIEERAINLLGLSWDDANDLFDEDNDRAYVLEYLDDLIVAAKEQRNNLTT